MRFTRRVSGVLFLALLFLGLFPGTSPAISAAQSTTTATSAANKPYLVEWVYRVKWGHQQEWLDIFKKYQVAILEKQKQLGYVKSYTIYAPSLHESEDARWDYRVIIDYAGPVAPEGQSEADVAKQLFPDQKQFKADEQHRWELTLVHWDLPIHVVTLGEGE